MMWTTVANRATLMLGVPSLSSAQLEAQGGSGPQAPAVVSSAQGRGWSRRAAVHRCTRRQDLKAVMFNWGWYMGCCEAMRSTTS